MYTYIYIYMCVCVCVCVFTQPLHREQECDTRSILKRNTASLNSEIFFLLLNWLPYQVKRNQSALLFTHCWRKKIVDCIPSSRALERNEHSLTQDLNTLSSIPFSTVIAVTLSTPHIYIYIYI